MKIYNKSGFAWGLIWTILGVWTFSLDLIKPDNFLPIQIKHLVLSALLALVGIISFKRALSRKATREDFIEEQDERNRLVTLKSKAKTLDILFWILTVFMTGGIIGYVLTSNSAWLLLFIVAGLILGLYWIVILVTSWHYEQHE